MNKQYSTLIISGNGDSIVMYNRILKFIYCSDNPTVYEDSIQQKIYDECNIISQNVKMRNDGRFGSLDTTSMDKHTDETIKPLDDMVLNKRYTITRVWYQRYHIDLVILLLCVIGALTLEPSSMEFWVLFPIPFIQIIAHIVLSFWYYNRVERKYRNILEHYDRVKMIYDCTVENVIPKRVVSKRKGTISIPEMLSFIKKNS